MTPYQHYAIDHHLSHWDDELPYETIIGYIRNKDIQHFSVRKQFQYQPPEHLINLIEDFAWDLEKYFLPKENNYAKSI